MTASRQEKRTTYAMIFTIFLILFILNGISYLNKATDPALMDTTTFLIVAHEMKQAGGALRFVENCLTGEYTCANAHPLYMLLLSGFAEPDVQFFVAAKLLTFLIGILNVLSLFWITYRLHSIQVAVASTALLTLNPTFLTLTTVVACDSLLVLCVLWTWYFLMRGVDHERDLVFAGLACGLAYLAKGTGLFVLGGYLFGGVLLYRRQLLRKKHYWLFLVAFVVVASPLLIRNQLVYGNPLYNVNSQIMWLDRWEEYYTPEFQASEGETLSLLSYFRSHSASEASGRLVDGIIKQGRLFYEINVLSVAWRLRNVILGFLGLSFIVGCLRGPRPRIVFSLSIGLVFFVLFSWFASINVAPRYLLPLVPLFLSISMFGAWLLLKRVIRNQEWVHRLWVAGLIVLAFLSGKVTLAEADLSDPRESYSFREGHAALMESLAERSNEANFMLGPTHSYPFFYSHGEVNMENLHLIPLVEDMEELGVQMAKHDIRFIVIDSEIVRRRPFLQDHFTHNKQRGLTAKQVPEAWKVVYQDESSRPDYFLFEVTQ